MSPDRRRFRLTVAYLGSGFAGWQRQRDQRTVQGELERALARVAGGEVSVVGAGRTDAGVHAAAQSAHVDLPAERPPDGVRRALDGLLGDDLRVLRVVPVRPDFHARTDAVAKRYVYRARWAHRPCVPWRALRWAPRPRVELPEVVEAAAELLVGRRDVASFTPPDHGQASTVRTLWSVEARFSAGGLILEFVGDGFLRYQVRRMAGTLLAMGADRLPPDTVHRLLDEPRPGAHLPTAPAHGLTLEKVWYRPPPVARRDPGSPPW